jgi:hypothetical protein
MQPEVSLTDRFPPTLWLLDFRAVLGTKTHEEGTRLLQSRVEERCSDLSLAEEYEQRFDAAFRYLLVHMWEFDQPGVGVVGSQGSALLDSLFYALYSFFMRVPLPGITQDYPVSAIVEEAQRITEEGKKRRDSGNDFHSKP